MCACVRGELFLGHNLLTLPTLFPEAHSWGERVWAPLNPHLRQAGAATQPCPPTLPCPPTHSLQQVLFLVEVLEEGRLTDELALLAHLFAGLPGLSQLHLQGAKGRPHHLAMAEVLERQ